MRHRRGLLSSRSSSLDSPSGQDFPSAAPRDLPKPVRITFFPGADVLPVFSPDGKKALWTSTRTPDRSPQLFIADFIPPKEE
jgi:hypothetical protein